MRPPISLEKRSPIPSHRPLAALLPPILPPLCRPCSPPSLARQPVCTPKRRGDGKHVCAMRTGIGVSRSQRSDVLIHSRRRQSCRTAKTYHTIVSKFADSLISRSYFAITFSFSFYISPSLFMSFAMSLAVLTSLRLFSFHLTTSLFSYLSPHFSTWRTISTHRRDFISHTSNAHGEVSWYAPAKFSAVQFARRIGRHRVKRAPCRLRLSE